MINPTTFVRKPFEIKAVSVTAENMAEVAAWCGGELNPVGGHDGRYGPFIRVKTVRPANPRQTQAFVGDWVTFTENGGFKVYTNKAFRDNFINKDPNAEVAVARIPKPAAPTPSQIALRSKPNLVNIPTQPTVRNCNG